MATLVIRINLDNAAFSDGRSATEARRIIEDYCRRWLCYGDMAHTDAVPLADVNGNTVGSAEIED